MASPGFYIAAAGVFAVASAGLLWVLKRRMRGRDDQPVEAFAPGWQFYPEPTSLEPPGTIFRIHPERGRFSVHNLEVSVQRGPEAIGERARSLQANTGLFAKFLGLASIEVGASKIQSFRFAMTGAQRELTTDDDLLPKLRAYVRGRDKEIGYRYYVIRECRLAKKLTHHFTHDQVIALGGHANVAQVDAKGQIIEDKHSSTYKIDQSFGSQSLRVTYLPEEIPDELFGFGPPAKARAVWGKYAGTSESPEPGIKLKAVTKPLTWTAVAKSNSATSPPPDEVDVSPPSLGRQKV